MHKAVREALANCLINADYYGVQGVIIKKESDKLILENPGHIRTGSGVPNIFNVWEDEGLEEPEIIEKFEPDRIALLLPFLKKWRKNTGKV